MDVILLKDYLSLGKTGDTVKAKPGFARNFLIPEGIALRASSKNLSIFKEQKKFEKVRRDSESFYKTRIQQQTKAIWRNIFLQSQDYIENNLKYKDSVKKIIKDVEKNNFDVNNASKIIFDSILKRNT